MSRIWTDEETDYLAENFEKLSDAELGKQLGRSGGAIEKKREAMRLIRKDRKAQSYVRYVPRKPTAKPIVVPTCPFEANRQLIIDWFRIHGERGYGEEPVNYRQILDYYKSAAA